MVLAVLGLLMGGAVLVRAALGLPDDLWGRLDGGGLGDGKLLAMAACLAGGGASAIGRELARRGRADRAAASICLAIVLPLAAFAAVAALTRPTAPPDKRFTDPSLPYSFSYPGYWSPESPDKVVTPPRTGLGAEVSKRRDGNMTNGVVVFATIISAQSLLTWLHATGDSGVHVVHDERRTVAGHEALTVDYQRRPGVPFQSRTAFFVGRTAFVIVCVVDQEPELAKTGCRKVLGSFAIEGDSPFEGTGAPRSKLD
jgi:hypothetical protein